MIASSSTFCPHPGRVIRDLFRQLHAVWHGMEAPVYSNHPREAAASSYLAIILGWIASGVPWFLRSTVVLMQFSQLKLLPFVINSKLVKADFHRTVDSHEEFGHVCSLNYIRW